MLKVFSLGQDVKTLCQELMKQGIRNGMKHVSICRLNAVVCNNKQRWNEDKCCCERKELIDKDVCDKDMLGILVIVNVVNDVMLVSM